MSQVIGPARPSQADVAKAEWEAGQVMASDANMTCKLHYADVDAATTIAYDHLAGAEGEAEAEA